MQAEHYARFERERESAKERERESTLDSHKLRPRMQKSHSYQEYGHNMGRETDVSIAKLVSRELRNHWYEYISLPLKCRLYSQILK